MKKRTARNTVLGIVVLCFMLTLCVFGTGTAAYAQQEEKLQKQEIKIAEEPVPEQKLFSKAKIEDDFDDSSVLVVMDKSISIQSKAREKSFFGNIEMTQVTDLTKFDGDVTVASDDGIKMTDVQQEKLDDGSKETIEAGEDDCEQILEISLTKNSKANVLKVIEQLEK